MRISPYPPQGESEIRLPTRRSLAKQNTRAKVLAAARTLFAGAGYEGATIRDIAAAAGMSTGAVFANFTDKSDLFREIMQADVDQLSAAMSEAANQGAGVDDALMRAFTAGYSFYMRQLPLARAAFALSWSEDTGSNWRALPPVRGLSDLIAAQLSKAVAAGELAADRGISLRGEMLYDAYLANFPGAIFQGWTLEALEARTREQIDVILCGARTR